MATHSFYVAFYTMQLIDRYLGSWSAQRQWYAVRYALAHDTTEARMSDIPGPVKRRMKDPAKFEALEAEVAIDMGVDDCLHPINADADIRKLIKVADLIDELFFLEGELLMGNQRVATLVEQAWDRLRRAVENAPIPYSAYDDVRSAIEEFKTPLQTLHNNDDVRRSAVDDDEMPL